MTADGKGNTYLYDEENRLIEVDTPSNPAIAKTVSVYDGLSRRVEKRTYNAGGALISTTRYLYDGLLPIAEYDSGNNLQNTYTRGLDLSGTMQGAGGIGGLLALTNASGNSYSYFTDGNGNVVDLADGYGTTAAHYEYDPFGNLVNSTGTLQQNYQWSSKEVYTGTGLVYYLYRFYSPSLGRWVNRDPSGQNGGLNEYQIVANNLIDGVDVFGLRPLNQSEKDTIDKLQKLADLADPKLKAGVLSVIQDLTSTIQGIQHDQADPINLRVAEAALDIWGSSNEAKAKYEDTDAGGYKCNVYVNKVLDVVGLNPTVLNYPSKTQKRNPLAADYFDAGEKGLAKFHIKYILKKHDPSGEGRTIAEWDQPASVKSKNVPVLGDIIVLGTDGGSGDADSAHVGIYLGGELFVSATTHDLLNPDHSHVDFRGLPVLQGGRYALGIKFIVPTYKLYDKIIFRSQGSQ